MINVINKGSEWLRTPLNMFLSIGMNQILGWKPKHHLVYRKHEEEDTVILKNLKTTLKWDGKKVDGSFPARLQLVLNQRGKSILAH
jgi:hypothetical protein